MGYILDSPGQGSRLAVSWKATTFAGKNTLLFPEAHNTVETAHLHALAIVGDTHAAAGLNIEAVHATGPGQRDILRYGIVGNTAPSTAASQAGQRIHQDTEGTESILMDMFLADARHQRFPEAGILRRSVIRIRQ